MFRGYCYHLKRVNLAIVLFFKDNLICCRIKNEQNTLDKIQQKNPKRQVLLILNIPQFAFIFKELLILHIIFNYY